MPRSDTISNATNVVATPQTIATNAIAFRTRDARERAGPAATLKSSHIYSPFPEEKGGTRDGSSAGSARLRVRRVDPRRGVSLVAGVALVPAFGAKADARARPGRCHSIPRTAAARVDDRPPLVSRSTRGVSAHRGIT